MLHSKNVQHMSSFVCYPRRGDSLSFYSKQCDRLFGLGKVWLEGPIRRLAERIFPLSGRGRSPLHHFFSKFFDWNESPLFKNFLRLDVHGGELTIRCFAASGCLNHERNHPVEDEVRTPLDTSGSHDRREQAPR